MAHSEINDGNLDVCLDNLTRHTDSVVRGINAWLSRNTWRRKNTVFVERTIPDGAKPPSNPVNTARFIRETQFPSLMKLATAIAHFDTVFSEVAVAPTLPRTFRIGIGSGPGVDDLDIGRLRPPHTPPLHCNETTHKVDAL